jgi:hypothetical protein
MALRLSERKLLSVECVSMEGTSPFMFPKKSTIRFDFGPIGNMPAVKLFWYDGLKENPKIAGVPDGEIIGDMPNPPRPAAGRGAAGAGAPAAGGRGAAPVGGPVGPVFNWDDYQTMMKSPTPPRLPTPDGSLFVGDKGMLTTGTYGENTRLIPVAKMENYRMPAQYLTRSPGHMRDFVRAAKGGDPACSNFSVAAPFVEWMLVGVLALRYKGKLEYDPAKMRIVNNAEATKLLKPTFRKGWEFHTVKG